MVNFKFVLNALSNSRSLCSTACCTWSDRYYTKSQYVSVILLLNLWYIWEYIWIRYLHLSQDYMNRKNLLVSHLELKSKHEYKHWIVKFVEYSVENAIISAALNYSTVLVFISRYRHSEKPLILRKLRILHSFQHKIWRSRYRSGTNFFLVAKKYLFLRRIN